MRRTWLAVGASIGGLAVALGAFGAHALASHLDARAMALFETANRYQLLHAFAICIVALSIEDSRPTARTAAASVFAIGILIFSGTLYAMALGAPRWLGAVTPIGGLCLIAGWLLLALAALRR